MIIDLGAVVDGYCSDMTRTVATGPLPPRLEEIYRVCLDAQEAALGGRPRRHGRRRARRGGAGPHRRGAATVSTSATGWGTAWACAIHERPGVRPEAADDAARPGWPSRSSPGIYLEGEGGVRIEDLVVLSDDGCEVLSTRRRS